MSGDRPSGSTPHDHDHDHEPGHAHAHGHSVPHVHGDPNAPPTGHRSDLPKGAGQGKWLLLDAFSGVAGDMTIAAAVDLGVPFSVVEDAVAGLPLAGFRLELRRAYAGAIGACGFDVVIEGQHPERSYREIDAMLQSSELDADTRSLARRIFRRLAEAEAEVHRMEVGDVHFHEVGAVDAIVDIVGAAACFSHLGARVISTPLPMGRGTVRCRHGVLPLPAPAAVACLKGVPTYDAGIDFELVTPTGAAIVATVAEQFVRWPSFAPSHIGWGAGTASLPDRPNALRMILGELQSGAEAARHDTHVVLETNVDDMTGELAAHAIEVLLAGGALDAWAAPVTMKKGRPGLVIAALAERAAEDRIAELMLRETSSIGIRHLPVGSRTERPRRMLEVNTQYGPIPVKISEGPHGPAQIKPEFDACVKAARLAAVPVREVVAAALRAASGR